jgi:hypothetical protein
MQAAEEIGDKITKGKILGISAKNIRSNWFPSPQYLHGSKQGSNRRTEILLPFSSPAKPEWSLF